MTERVLYDYIYPGVTGKIFRAYAALSMSEHKSGRDPSELINTITGDPNKQEKLIAALNMIGIAFPGAEKFVCNIINGNQELPYDCVDQKPLFGHGENIIFVRRNNHTLAPDYADFDFARLDKPVFELDLKLSLRELVAKHNRYYDAVERSLGLVV